MQQIIVEAIDGQRTLRLLYKGKWREVEPHTYGLRNGNDEALCAWQLSGGSGEDFRLFLISEVSDFSIGQSFAGPRDGYHRGDRRFPLIYAEL